MFITSAVNFKKAVAIILCTVILIMSVPICSKASINENGYIEIFTIEDLYNVRDDLSANYILMNKSGYDRGYPRA